MMISITFYHGTGTWYQGNKNQYDDEGHHHHGFYYNATPEATPTRPMARPPTPKSPDGRRPSFHDLPCEASRSAKMGEGRSRVPVA